MKLWGGFLKLTCSGNFWPVVLISENIIVPGFSTLISLGLSEVGVDVRSRRRRFFVWSLFCALFFSRSFENFKKNFSASENVLFSHVLFLYIHGVFINWMESFQNSPGIYVFCLLFLDFQRYSEWSPLCLSPLWSRYLRWIMYWCWWTSNLQLPLITFFFSSFLNYKRHIGETEQLICRYCPSINHDVWGCSEFSSAALFLVVSNIWSYPTSRRLYICFIAEFEWSGSWVRRR